MTPTSIVFLTASCIFVVVYLASRTIQALHRIASRIESTNMHVEELKTEIAALAEALSSSLIKLNDTQKDMSSTIEDLENEIENVDFYTDSEDMYENAKELKQKEEKASASLIQRRLGVGYARAARLLNQLENDGYIGPADGSRPREVLIGGEEE